MSEVLTGKGPQPPVVYWIRRGLVVLVAVIVVGLLVWAFLPKGEQPTTGVPAPADTPTDVASDPAPSPSGSPSDDMPTPSTSPSGSPAPPRTSVPISPSSWPA